MQQEVSNMVTLAILSTLVNLILMIGVILDERSRDANIIVTALVLAPTTMINAMILGGHFHA